MTMFISPYLGHMLPLCY